MSSGAPAELAARLGRVGRAARKAHALWRVVRSCLFIVGALLLLGVSLFGFEARQGLLALLRERVSLDVKDASTETWAVGSVFELEGVRFVPVSDAPGRQLGWLRPVDSQPMPSNVVLWHDPAVDVERFTLERIDPGALRSAPREELEATFSPSERSVLLLARTFEVEVVPNSLLAGCMLLLIVFAVLKVRTSWRELRAAGD